MDMIPVKSSAMVAVGYDQESRQLCIKFKQGNIYTFYQVPQYIFDGLMSSTSKGVYYNNNIRDKYQA